MRVAFLVLLIPVGFVAAQPPAGKPAAESKKLTVTVPKDDAELKIEGKVMNTPGSKREFDIPPVKAGETFEYEFEVSWKPNTYTVIHRKKTVTFKGGDDVSVDLTKTLPTDRAEVIYVPTPPDIVKRMVKLADVKNTDVAYELGCGDARIIIATVKGGAKKGIGIDRDPERVKESTENVKAAGLADKIEIRKGDIFDDTVTKGLDDATVVMLYMSDELDKLLRPKLLKNLKPGARIVSHRFLMGDWKPDKTEKIKGEDGEDYELHLWVVKESDKNRK
ncbi:MAG TPA: TIGR03000 domain-containing protein [Fimbriiglobus sp.]|jgi:uncharacterized protein (TIGR03000 family)